MQATENIILSIISDFSVNFNIPYYTIKIRLKSIPLARGFYIFPKLLPQTRRALNQFP